MFAFMCSLWPLVAAGLLGWLLCGLLARGLLRGADASGAIAAKDADIRRLSGEVSALRARPPEEKVVEKIVEKPVDRIVEKIVEKPVDRIIEKPVEKFVEKMVDNPSQAARIAQLTAEVAVIAGLRSRISQLESTPPKIMERVVEKIVEKPVDRIVEKVIEKPVDRVVEKIVEKPVDRIVEKIVEKPVDRIVEKIVEKPVEKIVEKLVDNPSQAARIAQLTAEVAVIAGLRGRISQLESAPPKVVEKVVEKIVEKPVEKIVEKVIEKPVDRVVEKIVEKPVDRIVEKIVEKSVDRIVEKMVDNPAQATRIAQLTAEVALISGLRSRISQLESKPPTVVEKVVEKLVEKPVDRVVEKIVEKPVDRIVEKVVEKVVEKPDPAVDIDAARRVGFAIKGADDLEVIEGIGPKIAELLRNDGIRTFSQLSRTPVAQLQAILDKSGPTFRVANPGTWPEQALLVAHNRWDAFKSLTDVLVAGVRVDTKAQHDAQKKGADASSRDASKRIADLEADIASLRAVPAIDVAAARAAGFTSLKGADDLEIIEGIGPKIAELFRADGVTTFAQLARMTAEQIQPMLDKAGPNFRMAKPESWPDQADLAARNRWATLKTLQDALTAGVRKA